MAHTLDNPYRIHYDAPQGVLLCVPSAESVRPPHIPLGLASSAAAGQRACKRARHMRAKGRSIRRSGGQAAVRLGKRAEGVEWAARTR